MYTTLPNKMRLYSIHYIISKFLLNNNRQSKYINSVAVKLTH